MIEILLADDHLIVREGIKSILRKYTNILIKKEVDNGENVIKELKREKYDILILDISLPKLNGIEVLEEIRRKNFNIKVLILSIHKQRDYIIRCFELGASGYLTKDILANELINAIYSVYNGKKYISNDIIQEITDIFDFINHSSKKLSNREYQILIMIAQGKHIKEISKDLNINEKTVSTYRQRILKKLNLKNNAEIIYYCIKNNIININLYM